jgi:hypothetical protein
MQTVPAASGVRTGSLHMTGRNKAIFFKRGLKIRQNRKLPVCQVLIDQATAFS